MKADRLPDPAIRRSYYKTERESFTENLSGIEPVGTKLLVLTDSVGDTTQGGITLTPDHVERMTLAITTGVVAAVGGACFTDWPNSDRKWPGNTPAVGTRVHIAKYAGIIVEGKDGKRYRLIQDVDVAGFETGEAKPQVFAAPVGQA